MQADLQLAQERERARQAAEAIAQLHVVEMAEVIRRQDEAVSSILKDVLSGMRMIEQRRYLFGACCL